MVKSENWVTLKHKNLQQFSLIWIVISVIVLFSGIFVSAAGSLSGLGNMGLYMITGAIISIILYLFFTLIQWFRFKKGEGFNNLVTAFIILAFLFTIGGLIGTFLTYPDGFKFFFVGLGMFALYWLIRLIRTIFQKEEDFS